MAGSLRKLWRDRASLAEIKPGHRFFRTGNVIETATMVGLRKDIVGIPHVHLSLGFSKVAIGHIDAGYRVLALPSFVATYQRHA